MIESPIAPVITILSVPQPRPENKKIQSHGFEVTPVIIWRPELNYQLSDYFIISRWEGQLNNGDNFKFEMKNIYTYLYDDFDPTRTENSIPLPANSEYHYTTFNVEYNNYFSSNEFTYNVEGKFGDFYNGSELSAEVKLSYRIQPKFTSSIEINYDRIRLPNPYPSADIILIAPRFEFTFTKNLYWATLVQYSNQRENLSFTVKKVKIDVQADFWNGDPDIDAIARINTLIGKK